MPEQPALTREFDTPRPVHLHIETGGGSVRVDAVETDRTAVRLWPARDGDSKALDLIARTTVDQHGDQIVIDVPTAGAGFLRSSPDVRIAVSVPAGSSLESTTKSADLRTTGRLDRVRATAGSGDVLLDHVGEAKVQSGSGDARVDRADLDVRVETGSGDVLVQLVAGGCTVSTGSGDVRLERADGAVQVNTGSGDVDIDDAGGDVSINTASGDHRVGRVRRGTVKVNSASGDVQVGVVEGTAVWLDVNSLSGTVHTALEGSDPPAEGEDAVALHVNTVSGDISLSHA